MNRLLATIAIAAALVGAQTTTAPSQADIDAHRAKIEQAIQTRDYAPWKAEHDAWMPNDTRLSGKVTAENFDKFAQMYEARKNGDMATAQKLRAELGIEPGGKGKGMGQGAGQGMGQGKGANRGSGNCTGSGSGAGKGMHGQGRK